jgi:hypothetical protein
MQTKNFAFLSVLFFDSPIIFFLATFLLIRYNTEFKKKGDFGRVPAGFLLIKAGRVKGRYEQWRS